MTVKILLLKSGEDVISDVKEMISPDKKVIGYFLSKPCVVKLLPKTTDGNKRETSISMYPWMPLSKEKQIPLPTDWVVTMVTPIEKVETMYKEDVLNGKPPIKLIVLMNQQRLVSQIEEIGADIGQPDCKLTEPFIVKDDNTLSPWLVESTNQSVFMLSSDKILTLVDPKPTLLEKYQDLLK